MNEHHARLKQVLSDIEQTGTCDDVWGRLAAYSYELADCDGEQYRLTKAGETVLESLRGETP